MPVRMLVVVAALAAALLVAVPTAQARTLSSGMCGGDVFALQVRLAKRSYLPRTYHTGCFDYRTSHAVIAFQGWVNFPRTGYADEFTQRRLVLSATPRPWTKARVRHLELHKSKQIVMLVGIGGKVQRTIHVSTAAPGHVTPTGHFTIYSKSPMSWSKQFQVWLPWASYVVGGIAFHSFPSVPTYPASHGCIRVPAPEAHFLYEWAPIGTRVWIGN